MVIKPRILYGLSPMKAQTMIAQRFLFEKFISSVFGKERPLFDLQMQKIRHF